MVLLSATRDLNLATSINERGNFISRKATNTNASDAKTLEVRYLKLSVDRTKKTTVLAPVPKKLCAVGGDQETPELYFSKHLINQIDQESWILNFLK